MGKRVKWLAAICALLVCAALPSCSDDDLHPAVGLTAGSVTPAGSFITYQLSAFGTQMSNAADSVDYDVTDEQLQKSILRVTPTIWSKAYCEGKEIGADGVEVDATRPVVVTVVNGGIRTTYTLNVVRAKLPGDHDALKKVAASATFAQGILDYDVVCFKNRLYAMVTSLNAAGDTEEYRLYASADAKTWEEIDYQTPGGVVMGGEGCRMAVFHDSLYVIGGFRSKAKDRNGNPAETAAGMYAGRPTVPSFRAYVSADGVHFKSCVTATSVYRNYGMDFMISTSAAMSLMGITQVHGTLAQLGDSLFMKSGYMFAFGMAQPARAISTTSDGENWAVLTAVDETGAAVSLPTLGDAFFAFKGRLWVVGGFSNFLSNSYLNRRIYSSSDGITWKVEGELPDDVPAVYQWTGIGTDNVAYIFGGEELSVDGTTRTLSSRVLRSTDGVNWESVAVTEAFVGSRLPRLAALGETIYYFGGYKGVSSGNYVFPTQDDHLEAEVWSKFIK